MLDADGDERGGAGTTSTGGGSGYPAPRQPARGGRAGGAGWQRVGGGWAQSWLLREHGRGLVPPLPEYGLAGLVDRPKPGAPPLYGPAERQRVLDVGRTPPDPQRDGTASWSLELLARRLRREAGLEHIDPTTVRRFFVEAGLSWQADRSHCTSTDAQLVEKARASRRPMPR
jgi:transposase